MSAWIGLGVVGAVALVALAVSASAFASAIALDASATRHVRSPGSDMPEAVQDALEDREPGEGIGDVISEIAQSHRPRPRH